MSIILVIHNIRSIHNVGSLLRTAECLGVTEVIISGYSPYPRIEGDFRLPHVINKIQSQMHKTALGAEEMLKITKYETFSDVVESLKNRHYTIVAIEQAKNSILMPAFKLHGNTALVVGNEVQGLDEKDIALCDQVAEIPMQGKKESLNVVQAAAIALYQAGIRNT